MKVDFEKLKEIENSIANQIDIKDFIKLEDVKTIAGFDVTYSRNKAFCAAVVFDIKSKKIIEKKCLSANPSMPYIPNFLTFREGPLVLQAYYDLESEPDVLMLDGPGYAHPMHCGIASYVGVELSKPAIGVAKNLLIGNLNENSIVLENEKVGEIVITKEHANPIFVSPGNMITITSAVELVKKTVFPPHKLPEPLHLAHIFSKKVFKINEQKLPILNDKNKIKIESAH